MDLLTYLLQFYNFHDCNAKAIGKCVAYNFLEISFQWKISHLPKTRTLVEKIAF